MTKADREEMLREIAKFRLMDDTFFHTCLKDSKPGMQHILRTILCDSKLVVLDMHTQEDVPNLFGRSVIFDVFVRDAYGREFNVEVQRAEDGADPHRARYHACILDVMHVEKNMGWKNMPPTIVIFITETDVLGGGLPIYHVERVIREMGGQRFRDDAGIIYVNGTIQDDTPLGLLMQDFACRDPEKMHSEILAERVRFYKSDEHGVSTMCRVMEEFAEKYAKKYAEKYAEGKLEEGRAQGVAEKTLRTILNQLRRRAPYADIASDNETSVDEVIRIAKENNLAY